MRSLFNGVQNNNFHKPKPQNGQTTERIVDPLNRKSPTKLAILNNKMSLQRNQHSDMETLLSLDHFNTPVLSIS